MPTIGCHHGIPGGTARRGPVTLRLRDLERLRAALADHPDLAEVLRLGVD